jgi:hypothetical protein
MEPLWMAPPRFARRPMNTIIPRETEWKPLPFRSKRDGHVCEVLYVRGRYWGQIEQLDPDGPCYASTIRGRIGATMDIAAARAAVERTLLKNLRTDPLPDLGEVRPGWIDGAGD